MDWIRWRTKISKLYTSKFAKIPLVHQMTDISQKDDSWYRKFFLLKIKKEMAALNFTAQNEKFERPGLSFASFMKVLNLNVKLYIIPLLLHVKRQSDFKSVVYQLLGQILSRIILNPKSGKIQTLGLIDSTEQIHESTVWGGVIFKYIFFEAAIDFLQTVVSPDTTLADSIQHFQSLFDIDVDNVYWKRLFDTVDPIWGTVSVKSITNEQMMKLDIIITTPETPTTLSSLIVKFGGHHNPIYENNSREEIKGIVLDRLFRTVPRTHNLILMAIPKSDWIVGILKAFPVNIDFILTKPLLDKLKTLKFKNDPRGLKWMPMVYQLLLMNDFQNDTTVSDTKSYYECVREIHHYLHHCNKQHLILPIILETGLPETDMTVVKYTISQRKYYIHLLDALTELNTLYGISIFLDPEMTSTLKSLVKRVAGAVSNGDMGKAFQMQIFPKRSDPFLKIFGLLVSLRFN